MPTNEFDALVIGGGPAGATAAALLASWGRSVVLIHHDASQPSLAESLPASTCKLFRFLGQLDAVDAAAFHPNHGNISHWAGKEARTSTEPGYHVHRGAFDRVLRGHARAVGATVVDAQVRHVDIKDAIHIDCVAGPRAAAYDSRFVLDCSGRAGVIARRGLRKAGGYRTLAITAEWECPAWPIDERAHTIVDSYAHGWAWSVPVSDTRRQCTVMVDADLMTVSKSALAATYYAELRETGSIFGRLARCTQRTEPWGCDASLYACVRAAEGNALLVGDAASFIEPLSSAGVKKALTSAWRAAVAVNTALEKPGMQDIAFDYHDRRERGVYVDCLRRSAAFFKNAAEVHHDEFWARRAASLEERDDACAGEAIDIDLAADPAIRETFERLRTLPVLDLSVAPHLRFEPVAVVEDREVVLRDGVRLPGVSAPVRYGAGVDLPALIRLAAECRDIESLIQAYHTRVAVIDPRDLVAGLSLLVARGLMLEVDTRTASPL
jgi:flavin-dependent dehydrogenase